MPAARKRIAVVGGGIPQVDRLAAALAPDVDVAHSWVAPLSGVDAVLAGVPSALHAAVLRLVRVPVVLDLSSAVPDGLVENDGTIAPLPLQAASLRRALRVGDHFLCADERQRSVLIGALMGERLISGSHYDRDPTLRGLIDIVSPEAVRRVLGRSPAKPPVPLEAGSCTSG